LAQPPSKTGPSLDDAFLREVDEEVRRDQISSLWKRWGPLIIALVVGGLAALGGWLWWQDQQRKAAAANGELMVQAIDKIGVGDNAGARPLLDQLVKEGTGSYPALAQIMQAADQVAVGEEEKGAALLEKVIADAKVAQPLRDAALIKLVRLRFDALPPADVVARLKPLAVPGAPWFGLAGEMTALAHVKAGAPEQAKPLLIAIVKDKTLPDSLRNRAGQLALSLGVDEAALGLDAPADAAAGSQSASTLPAPAAPVTGAN
jgi:hypothetical protein